MKSIDNHSNCGITLVALVITVIILLILASIALSLITGQNGLFARANQAKDDYNKVAYAESLAVNGLQDYLTQYDIYGVNDNNNQNEEVDEETLVAQHYQGLAEVDEIHPDLFTYNVHPQTNECFVTGINYDYFISGYSANTEDAGSWLKGEEYTNTLKKLVIPYQVTINGTTYPIQGVSMISLNLPYFSWEIAGDALVENYVPYFYPDYIENNFPDDYVLPSLASGSNYSNLSTSTTTYLVIPDTVETLYCNFPRDYILYPENNSLSVVSFSQNFWLREFVIPRGVTNIDSGIFDGCCSLENIYIPSTVTSIEDSSLTGSGFYHYVEYTNIYYEGSESDWNALVGNKDIKRWNNNYETVDVSFNEEMPDFNNY